jgi:hypothetical protein
MFKIALGALFLTLLFGGLFLVGLFLGFGVKNLEYLGYLAWTAGGITGLCFLLGSANVRSREARPVQKRAYEKGQIRRSIRQV